MLIKVKVFPDSLEENVVKKIEDSFDVWVKERPVMGLANRAVIGCLAEHFGVSTGNIRLIKGFRESNKIFDVKI